MIRRAFLLMSIAGSVVNAQTITENFGTGVNSFSIDFVTIGNPNNATDATGYGSVAYTYNMGKYEVSREMIDKANAAGGLGITLQDMTNYSGNGANKPATGVNWYEAAKFVNWLNTSTGGQAAYKFDGSGKFQLWSSTDAGYNAANQFRNSLAKYVIASTDEWYKASYGSPNGIWYNYPTGSNTAPTPVGGGTDVNTAVYNRYDWESTTADIFDAGGLSAYGTMAQGGNVWEWNESAFDGHNDMSDKMRDLRGGSWGYGGELAMNASTVSPHDPNVEEPSIGFRVASTSSVPEPSALSLLAVGLGGLAMMRRRRS
jgi:formylglycine-generating enzyme required for sulfatase activity